MGEESAKENKLITEKSPYLLQHAYNPVDWHPWSQEAFEKAKNENKPVFLSIGYSTCHWCHVMARESFEDEEVASLLNQYYVPVKVDREERPDIDHVYMTVCRMMTGGGGWPLTVIMTPDKKAFFAGTYFPKYTKFGLHGLTDILSAIAQGWEKDRKSLEEKAELVTKALRGEDDVAGPEGVSGMPDKGWQEHEALLDKAYKQFSTAFDSENGGFGTAPKFPSPHNLLFLLRYWRRTGEKHALEMAERTVHHAYCGGIYDHLGFGFFRYSTDSQWLVPHFEKMLYDNALWVMALTELFLATKKDVYKRACSEIIEFISNEMRSEEGYFYSAIDAESEGVEGKFYLWDLDEILETLGKEDGALFAKTYGVTREGNFNNSNVLNLLNLNSGIRREQDKAQVVIGDRDSHMEHLRKRLMEHRDQRVRPGTDDKMLTGWNSLAIAALAKAGAALGESNYISMAEQCYGFIKSKILKNGKPYARYRDGEVAYPGYIHDYAFLTWALVELHQSTLNQDYLDQADLIAGVMIKGFWDEEGNSFYLSSAESEQLVIRPKEIYDGAVPSGNSAAVMDLIRLFHLNDREQYENVALAAMNTLFPQMQRYPMGYAFMLCAVDFAFGGAQDILVSGKDSSDISSMVAYIRSLYLPNAQIKIEDDVAGKSTIKICRNRTCGSEICSIDRLQKALLPLTNPKNQVRRDHD